MLSSPAAKLCAVLLAGLAGLADAVTGSASDNAAVSVPVPVPVHVPVHQDTASPEAQIFANLTFEEFQLKVDELRQGKVKKRLPHGGELLNSAVANDLLEALHHICGSTFTYCGFEVPVDHRKSDGTRAKFTGEWHIGQNPLNNIYINEEGQGHVSFDFSGHDSSGSRVRRVENANSWACMGCSPGVLKITHFDSPTFAVGFVEAALTLDRSEVRVGKTEDAKSLARHVLATNSMVKPSREA
ncbi:uncharacterized protein UV8b_01146 [Ustilaginoidea virens]|uniref:Uncharacterized protein n=1 Tax=Ustilaginoidea virens TaxID=1159556 RepID=A0A8E5HKF7_USTVR|nr:uncharacterized protein UV8b_01146 [Ustilaginoidea virens]QUC16905.1 hypothetical protein UV8b_01146 [Ustilaginoidea virens]